MKILPVGLSFIFLLSTSSAQWVEDGVLISEPSEYLWMTGITTDGRGGAIVAWHDKRGEDWDIYVQRVDSSGVALWEPNGVPACTASENQGWPKIISDGKGGAIIVWEHMPDGVDIYAQRVDSKGEVLWKPNGVPVVTAPRYQLYPRMISDGRGGAIIVWEDERPGGTTDIYAQRIDSSGMARWTPDGVVICDAPDCQFDPELTTDGAGGAVITWWDYYRLDVCVQRVDSSGTTLWEENGVCMQALGTRRRYPRITSDGAGGAIIAWHSQDSTGILGVYAQRVNQDGELQWAEHGVLVFPPGSSYDYLRLVSNDRGGAIILTLGVRLQRIDKNGNLVWENGVYVRHMGTYFETASDKAGGVIVAGYPEINNQYDIYVNRVDSSGVILWDSTGVAVCTAPSDQRDPVLVNDGEGGAIIAWNDFRHWDIGFAIYAQRVYSDGSVGGVGVREYANGRARPAFILLRSYPNPFDSAIAIKYWVMRPTRITLKIYDIAGRKVKTLVDELKEPGTYRAFWDGRDKEGKEVKSGVYFYTLRGELFSQTRKIILLR